MNLPDCCFCGRPIMELEGQFTHLPAYLLLADDELKDKSAFGSTHYPCLFDSGLGPLWRQRRLAHSRAMGRESLVDEETGILHNTALNETLFYFEDGYMVALKDRYLAEAKPVEEGVLVNVNQEYNMELDDFSELASTICQSLEQNGSFPVIQFLRATGLDDKILRPEFLASARFLYDEELAECWLPRWVSARVEYDVFLPRSGFEVWQNWRQKRATTH